MLFTRYTTALLAAATLGAGLIIPDDNKMAQKDGLIRYPIIPKQGGPLYGRHFNMTKRQVGTDSLAHDSGAFYTIDLVLGTPGQTVPVMFDTGSAELWVNPVCAESNAPEFCDAQPRFTNSTTVVDLGEQGSIRYGAGFASFEYVSDYVAIGSAKITQQIFGVAERSAHLPVGIMGAGPSLDGWQYAYPLPIDSLAKQGLINSRAFSLDLRGLDSARGSVVFGGVDVKKYTGNLAKLPIIPAAEAPDGQTRFWVYVNGISVNQPNGNVIDAYTTPAGGKGQPVLLDSGCTLSSLPSDIFQKIVCAFPSAKRVTTDEYTVDCLDSGQHGSLDFTFGDAVINVRYSDFIWRLADIDECVLGVTRSDHFPILGDTFLRSAYAVFDWDNRQIHLGQSSDCGSELVAIGSGPDAVPSLMGECGPRPTSTSTTVTETTAPPAGSTTVASTTVQSSIAQETSTVPESSSSSTIAATSTSSSPSLSSTTSITSQPSISKSIITYTTTSVHTITSCPPTVTHCPLNKVTTEVITSTTAVCPETTATYTLHKTITCAAHGEENAGDSDCPPGSTKTATLTLTVSPVAPEERATRVVPGAAEPSTCGGQCGSGSGTETGVAVASSTTTTTTKVAAAVPAVTGEAAGKCRGAGCGRPGGNGTVTGAGAAKPTKGVVTAGSVARVRGASGAVAVVVGAVLMVAVGL